MNRYTIIIPVHNSPAYLKRLLNLLVVQKCLSLIIIADSSSKQQAKIYQKIINEFSSLSISYQLYSSYICLYRKIEKVLPLVNTEFLQICAEDDCIFLKGVEQSIEFLLKNPDYSTCRGLFYSFFLQKRTQQFLWSPATDNQSLKDNEKNQRVKDYKVHEAIYFYGTHRIRTIQKILEIHEKNEIKIGFLNEHFFIVLLAIMGKMKKIPVLFYFKEMDILAGGNKKEYREFDPLSKDFLESKEKIKKVLSFYCKKESSNFWLNYVISWFKNHQNPFKKSLNKTKIKKIGLLRRSLRYFMRPIFYLKRRYYDKEWSIILIEKYQKELWRNKKIVNGLVKTIKESKISPVGEEKTMDWQIW